MPPAPGSITRISRRLAFTQDQADELAQEFADDAALAIADHFRIDETRPYHAEACHALAAVVRQAIHSTIDHLPREAAQPPLYRPPQARSASEFAPLKTSR